MKRVALLGSTGSIGKNVIEVARAFPDEIRIVALSANINRRELVEQIKAVKPLQAAMRDEAQAEALKTQLQSTSIEVCSGIQGMCELVKSESVDTVVTAVMGADGLLPTITAIEHGKDVLLANKETLVAAGEIVMKKAAKHNVRIIPIDSEHSALLQCLEGRSAAEVDRLLLTASGGPFRNSSQEEMRTITVEKALDHPNWIMGKKITIDSATMMNKGLELIEARWLFDIPLERVEIVIHPQSIIHSMVEYCDGSILAQLSLPDMRIPIQYALLFPHHCKNSLERIDFSTIGSFEFAVPDTEKFPALGLAREADAKGGTLPSVMNAANEIAVGRFLKKEIAFTDIIDIVERVMQNHTVQKADSLDVIIASDEWARKEALR